VQPDAPTVAKSLSKGIALKQLGLQVGRVPPLALLLLGFALNRQEVRPFRENPMQRTFRWSWLGAVALAAGPTLALAQDASTQSHTVRQGDTLWDLARQYRGDPFLWPDIFRLNTSVVEDPHWIYPGEILSLSATDAVASVPAQDTPAPPAAPAADSSTAAPVSDQVAESPVVGTEAEQAPLTSLASLTKPSPEAEDGEPLFGPRPGDTMHETLRAYTDQPYRALRRSEFHSSGFLTEGQKLPFGKVLGTVTPPQIRATPYNNNALPYATVSVSAPKGATYQVGDSLLAVVIAEEVRGFGHVVEPSGILQVVDTADGKYLASVIAVYGTIRGGHSVLPLERFADAGSARAMPVSDGVRAKLLGGAGRQSLKVPQMVVFLDKGRQAGVAPGDLFEIRRRPERLDDGNVRVDEVMATLQVVHVRERTATARVLNVVSPDILPGSEVRQVAKLP
jgi:nucleoid-associated protein YgaU